MVNTYTITLKNESGNQQKYALFNKAPVVTGRVTGNIWANVFAVANTPSGSQAKFTMYDQYYAFVGTSQGKPGDGVSVDVATTREVNLGSTSPAGAPKPGTTLQMTVTDGAPDFSHSPLPDGSFVKAFEIKTGPDFTVKEASKNNYMIGLASRDVKSGNDPAAAATFQPEPNVSYQIQPVNTYHLTFGSFSKGNMIDAAKLSNTLVTVDYTVQNDDVTIVHNQYGNLVIQSA